MPNNMAFHTEKDLNSKCQGVKSLYFSQGCQYRMKFEIKAKKICLKKAYFMEHPNSGS